MSALDRIEQRARVAIEHNYAHPPSIVMEARDVLALVAIARAAQAASFAIWENSPEEIAAAEALRSALARLDAAAQEQT